MSLVSVCLPACLSICLRQGLIVQPWMTDVTLSGLELQNHMPQILECSDCRHGPPYPAQNAPHVENRSEYNSLHVFVWRDAAICAHVELQTVLAFGASTWRSKRPKKVLETWLNQ